MEGYIDTLELLYKSALESGSDSLFYQNIHRYIDYIKKNPELASIIDKRELLSCIRSKITLANKIVSI